MTLDAITNQFNVIKLLDLNVLDTGLQKDIYDQLKPLHKETFENNERIVFYCFSPLSRKFADFPAETLIHLQKMLVYIDIPNFFCIVITNDAKLQQDLIYVCDLFTKNETPIKAILYEVS
jgi:hypothetical protein